jgi:hypothetical protein
MNRYLTIAAAALLGTAAPVCAADQAKMHTIHFLTANGGSYCDGMSFQKVGRHTAAGLHLNEDCNGRDVQVMGTVDKTRFTLNENQSSYSLGYDIYKPIRNGGAWDLWTCFNGTSCFQSAEGIYKLGFPAERRGQVSTTAKVAEMIAARKAARANAR